MRELREKANTEGREKVSEKHLLTRGVITLAVVIFCLIAMTLTAYAYYSFDITSGSNKIKAAFFDVDIIIDDGNIAVAPGPNKTYKATLPAGTHSIKITHSSASTANNGFVMVETENGVYYTRQLTKSSQTDEFIFSFETNVETVVEFSACWGTSIYHNTQNEAYLTESNSVVKISVAGASEENGQEPDVPEITEPEATEPDMAGPDATEPEVTEPQTTEPEATEPEATEPESTEPESTEPENIPTPEETTGDETDEERTEEQTDTPEIDTETPDAEDTENESESEQQST